MCVHVGDCVCIEVTIVSHAVVISINHVHTNYLPVS